MQVMLGTVSIIPLLTRPSEVVDTFPMDTRICRTNKIPSLSKTHKMRSAEGQGGLTTFRELSCTQHVRYKLDFD